MLWRRWTSDEIADLQRLYPDPTISTNELKRRFARNYGTIKAMARRLGLRRERIDLWYDVDVAKLVQLYSDEDVPSEQIEATLGRTWRAICHKANQIGLQRPKPNRCGVVRDYFHTIDTAEKAYWLGFIAADGTVDDRPRRYNLTIDLQPRDLHWLQRFRDIIAPGGHNHPARPALVFALDRQQGACHRHCTTRYKTPKVLQSHMARSPRAVCDHFLARLFRWRRLFYSAGRPTQLSMAAPWHSRLSVGGARIYPKVRRCGDQGTGSCTQTHQPTSLPYQRERPARSNYRPRPERQRPGTAAQAPPAADG